MTYLLWVIVLCIAGVAFLEQEWTIAAVMFLVAVIQIWHEIQSPPT